MKPRRTSQRVGGHPKARLKRTKELSLLNVAGERHPSVQELARLTIRVSEERQKRRNALYEFKPARLSRLFCDS